MPTKLKLRALDNTLKKVGQNAQLRTFFLMWEQFQENSDRFQEDEERDQGEEGARNLALVYGTGGLRNSRPEEVNGSGFGA